MDHRRAHILVTEQLLRSAYVAFLRCRLPWEKMNPWKELQSASVRRLYCLVRITRRTWPRSFGLLEPVASDTVALMRQELAAVPERCEEIGCGHTVYIECRRSE